MRKDDGSGRLNWHRLFGLVLTDYFDGTGYRVELEMDLSVKRQLLDVVVVRAEDGARLSDACDGLEELAPHNLITYKSMRESLTDWSLDELVGHYVNYRKKLGTRKVASSDVRLFAVATRHPTALERRFGLEKVKPGVYNLPYGAHTVRVIVLPDVTESMRNALWELFSARPDRVERGADEYKFHIKNLSTIIDDLFERYQMEGLKMPYTVEQYKKDFVLAHLKDIPPEEVLTRFKPKDRLAGLKPKDVLNRYKPEDRLAGLKPEDRLAGLKPEEVERWLSSHGRRNRRRK